jgi:DtxR family transcriptional regulator, Mn-dependent transcriptional regulator
MTQLSLTSAEEDYIKSIFKLAERESKLVHTNAIAKQMDTTAASVTDMIKKLSQKGIVHYQKYYGVTLSPQGQRVATMILRRNRLWEVFLVNKLRFPWYQVEKIANHLEHIQEPDLIERLDAYLDYPKFDPHGDPIPNAEGRFTIRNQVSLAELHVGQTGTVVGVRDDSEAFLYYLSKINVKLGTKLEIIGVLDYEKAAKVKIDNIGTETLSQKVTALILVKGG